MPAVLQNKDLTRLKNTSAPASVIKQIESFTHSRLKDPPVIKKYHDLLLFYCAFPFNKLVAERSAGELQRIAQTIKKVYAGKNKKLQNALMGSGMASSALLCSYSQVISQWLVTKFPDFVTFSESGATKETVRNIMQAMIPSIEYEKSSQGELSLLSRIKQLSGLPRNNQLLKWLLHLFTTSGLSTLIKEELYRQLNVFVYWKLNDKFYNRSFLRWPVNRTYYHNKFIKRVSAKSIVKKKINNPISLSATEKEFLIDSMRASLSFQYRETDPVTYADSDELVFFDVGRGLSIAITGMTRDRRLSLESYIGYMAFKNGIPVSYGGGWIWGSHCKIGINIFDPFRQGESAWLFCQVLRIYHQHFHVNRFGVTPYQFGKGNPEGLKSGAFWFYYKLGFRPADEVIKNEAEKEWKHIQANKNYRTPIDQLKFFTGSNMEWQIAFEKQPVCPASAISIAVTRMINKDFQGDRKRAVTACLKKMYKLIPEVKREYKNSISKEVIENWSLLVNLLPATGIRKPYQKNALQRLIHEKHTGKERQYILLIQKQGWLFQLLSAVTN